MANSISEYSSTRPFNSETHIDSLLVFIVLVQVPDDPDRGMSVGGWIGLHFSAVLCFTHPGYSQLHPSESTFTDRFKKRSDASQILRWMSFYSFR